MLKTILLFSTKWQVGQAHLNRFRTIPAPPAPAARLRPSAPLRRVHTTPQAAARPAAGCPAAAHRLPGPDGRFERAQRKTRGSRQARRGTWPPPTPSAEVELNTARNGALTSRYGIERTDTAFKRLVTSSTKFGREGAGTFQCPRPLYIGRNLTYPVRRHLSMPQVGPCKSSTTRPACRPVAPVPTPSSRGPPHPAPNRDSPAAWGYPRGYPKVRGGVIFNKAFLSGFHFAGD